MLFPEYFEGGQEEFPNIQPLEDILNPLKFARKYPREVGAVATILLPFLVYGSAFSLGYVSRKILDKSSEMPVASVPASMLMTTHLAETKKPTIEERIGAIRKEFQEEKPPLAIVASQTEPDANIFNYRAVDLPENIPFKYEIIAAAMKYNVDPFLLVSIIENESGFDPSAESPKGARGLMQVMPTTAELIGFSRDDMWDPRQNIRAGAKYIRLQLDRFKRLDLALAAYNAGPGMVLQFSDNWQYYWPETQEYVPKVMRRFESLTGKPLRARIALDYEEREPQIRVRRRHYSRHPEVAGIVGQRDKTSIFGNL